MYTTHKNMLQLDPDQTAFIRNISDDLVGTKDLIVAGPHGSGKTMLSVEAVKIKSSNILKHGQQVRVHILTFNNRLMDHGLLNAELQNNWFSAKNQSNRVEISHFTDFLEDMLHGSKKKTYLSDFKKSLMLIADKLNQNTNNKTIVMIDELRVDCIFKKSVIKCNAKKPSGRNVTYNVDFSYLRQYENVHFIISLHPQAGFGADFDIIFPKEQIIQYYMILKNRHRHTPKILEFLQFYHDNTSGNRMGLIKIDAKAEHDLNADTLPPLLDGLEHGVIWLTSKTDYFHAKQTVIDSEASEVNDVIQKLIGKHMTIVILCDSKNAGNESFIAGMKKVNPDYVGPYGDKEFNGIEADVIFYLCHYNEKFSISSMARARRLLILVSWDRDYDELMENAVAKGLLHKSFIKEKYQETMVEEVETEDEEDIIQNLPVGTKTVVMPSSAKTYLEAIKLAELDNGKEIHDQKMKILKIQEEEAAFRRDIASAELNLLRQRNPQYCTHDTKDEERPATIMRTKTTTPTLTTYEEYRKLSAQYRKSSSSSGASNESVNPDEQLFVKSHSSWF